MSKKINSFSTNFQIESRGQTIDRKIESLDKQLAKDKKQLQNAKGMAKDGIKRRMKRNLQQKKMYATFP